jgi:hypothetical protein
VQRLAPLFADLGTVRHREREPYGYGLELGFAGGQLVVLGHNGPVPVPGGGDRGGGPLVPALGLSYRDVEELLAERGIDVDHVTVYRWVQPVSIEAFLSVSGEVGARCRSARFRRQRRDRGSGPVDDGRLGHVLSGVNPGDTLADRPGEELPQQVVRLWDTRLRDAFDC